MRLQSHKLIADDNRDVLDRGVCARVERSEDGSVIFGFLEVYGARKMDWEDRVLHSAFNKFFYCVSHCVLGADCGGGNVSLCDILEYCFPPIPPT